MREIKFRAWDNSNKEMRFISRLFWHSGLSFPDGIRAGEFYPSGGFFIERVELMQYTGLKDKNGREIYEGDIIKDRTGIYEVFYSEDDTSFVLRKPTMPKTGHYIKNLETNQGFRRSASSDDVEIFGNIYENPELINNK